ncbi:MAG TPA: DEAD/DEAH box helicase [Patescibacteria group bacterium]|nr:DEAD/DEAH box helicase [Patescibacteria group bacterium]
MSLDDTAPPATSLPWAHPVVSEWFFGRFGSPTEPQLEGWPHIVAGRTVLISAPTGSGKTLAAFLAAIDRLIRKAVTGELGDRTEVLYVSPLRALSTDIDKNLQAPLGEIQALALGRGLLAAPVRSAVRTGDTLAQERRRMIERPPHILVTTPESLYILLTAERSRQMLRTVETVIIDEIHAVADDKRGAHLALSLERLEALAGRPIPRIGLSATQKPIERLGRFLAGASRLEPVIVEIGRRRTIDLGVEVPRSELGPIATNQIWDETYDRIAELAGQQRSTLVFVNTRRLAERVAFHLAERMGQEVVAAHHGSLSRKIRHEAERRLKAGELKALVATASLELGIDIGSVDLVCQIGSPRSIAVTLQRVGRSGHWRGAVPKGRLLAMTRDDLLECAALVRAIRGGELDAIEVTRAPLDVLAQQIVAACAAEEWSEEELFALVRRADPYRELSRADFDEIVEMLSEGIATRRGRHGARLHRDRVNGRLRARRGARLLAVTNAGAIPETALYPVILQPEGATIGAVDEDFAVESMRGDVFLLGNRSWRIERVEKGRLLVADAGEAPPNVPFWRGEAPGRTPELSDQVAGLRGEIARRIGPNAYPAPPLAAGQAQDWLRGECGLDQSGAEQAVEYVASGQAALGAVPDSRTFIAERFFDESGAMQLVIHAPLGSRINKAWGLALRKRFCRSFNFELQAAATDNGIVISLGEQHSFPLADVFRFLSVATARHLLEQAALPTPLFTSRWRWSAARSLALPRFLGGRKVPFHIQRMRAEDLLAAVFPGALACPENLPGDIPIPDHPLVRETMNDVLTEALDLEGFERILGHLAAGRIRAVAADTASASPFSHEILNANPYAFLDDAPLEERRARAVTLRRLLPDGALGEIGRLDPEAVAEVTRQAWPDVRDADELHDALVTLVAFPESRRAASGVVRAELEQMWRESVEKWSPYFEKLARDRRVSRAAGAGRTWWVPAERTKTFARLFPDATLETGPPAVEAAVPSAEEAAARMLIGWLGHIGPVSAAELAEWTGLPAPVVDVGLARLEAEGAILRGNFTGGVRRATEWCQRHLLARIHRQTLGRLRREIAPVTAAQFLRWLLRWQHVAPGTQLTGENGTIQILRQLQGFEAPANAWEPQILARRIAGYDPKILDRLCLGGVVGWGRLTPRSSAAEPGAPGRRVVPSSVTPIAFFLREDADWLALAPGAGKDLGGLSSAAREVLEWLGSRGASFFADVVRGTRRLKTEVETALWELVAAGRVTADDFDNLRALVDPKRRAGHGSGRAQRPRHSTGRWSLLDLPAAAESSTALESACRMLLERYGVVFREVATRENGMPSWREILVTLRRLEDRGEVRGGRFVDGFLGEQFALPIAVESLRAQRGEPATGEIVTVAAADPLNLLGILAPGERVSSASGKFIAYEDGVPLRVDQRPQARLLIAR